MSDQRLCKARVDIQQREAAANDRIFKNNITGNGQTWGGRLFTDFVNERTTCVLKHGGDDQPCSNTGPQLYDPCGLMWIPTKNRLAPHSCPKPDGGDMCYIDQPRVPVDGGISQSNWCRADF